MILLVALGFEGAVMVEGRERERIERWPQCARAARVPPQEGGCMYRTAMVGWMKLLVCTVKVRTRDSDQATCGGAAGMRIMH